MPTWFERKTRPLEEKLDRLVADVEDGDLRLDEPRRITSQIGDIQESMEGLIKDRIDWSGPVRDCRVSSNDDLQSAWRSRHDELAEDTANLKKGRQGVEDLRDRINSDTEELRKRWENARTVVYTDEPPEPDEQAFESFWDRVAWAWQQEGLWKKIRAFLFDRCKLIPKEAETHEVQVDRLLSERPPSSRVLQQSLKTINRSAEECQSLLEEVEQITIPHVADMRLLPEDQ